METETLITLVWLVVGVLLLLSEVWAPGFVVGFLGIAAMIVAGGRWIGLIEGLPMSFGVWIVCSVVLVLALRRVVRRWFPSDEMRENTEEENEAFGLVVEVTEDIDDEGQTGRIRYQGTSWPAQSTSGVIPAGKKARLVCRAKEGLGWLVEPEIEIEPESLAPKKGE